MSTVPIWIPSPQGKTADERVDELVRLVNDNFRRVRPQDAEAAADTGPIGRIYIHRANLKGLQSVASNVLSAPFFFFTNGETFHLGRVGVRLKSGVTSADVIWDVLVSTDGGATYTSIFPSGDANKLVILSGEAYGETSNLEINTFSSGHIIRIDVIETDGAASGAHIAFLGVYS